MELELSINGVIKSLEVAPNETLLTMLRREGYASVRHGCESGDCGACTVLVDGTPRPGCVTLAAQTGGCTLTTVEGLGTPQKLHALQEAFIDTGAVQCGFCTPGMLLSASALLKHNPAPSEEEVREALSGNLCRCSGYARPVQAVLRAAAVLRGETPVPISLPPAQESSHSWTPAPEPRQHELAPVTPQVPVQALKIAGKPVRRVDGVKLVSGKPAFTDDIDLREMLYARVLTSPHAHALIRDIDVSEARAVPGVMAILTYKDVPRIPSAGAIEAWPERGPHDQFLLDNHVRFVGDRVAVVAAESVESAEQALRLIQVDYDILPAVLDPRLASSAQAPRLHPENDVTGIYDATQNIAAHFQYEIGSAERGFAQSDLVVEGEYVVPQVQSVPLETHVAITHWDVDGRLVVRTNTQAPYHLRRMLATLVGLPPRQIRVIKPNSAGDAGGRQDLLVEDLCALLTINTGRPVRLEYTRAEEFRSSRTRHAHIVRVKTGVRRDGTIMANSLLVLSNTGAYGMRALPVSEAGLKALNLYPCANLSFEAQVVYTNLPPAGTARGDGAPQIVFALESHLDEVARQIGLDALELRRKNWIREGHEIALVYRGEQGKEGEKQILRSCGLAECLRLVEEKLQWQQKRGQQSHDRFRRGVGIALAMDNPPNSAQELSSATLRLNEDGSFHLFCGVTSDGNGSDTMLAQIAAETLGVGVEDIILHPLDTDTTPFANHSSIALSGAAVAEVAEQVYQQILVEAAHMLQLGPAQLTVRDRLISGPDGRTLTYSQVALHASYVEKPHQITATASWVERSLQPSFAAQGAEVEVDSETGIVRVLRVVSAVDAGRVLNPIIVEGLIEGATALALSQSLSEELLYDQRGNLLTTTLSDYRILNALDLPALETCIVESEDPSGPFGAKVCEEIAGYALAPAIANAVADALGVRLRQIPLTPERVLRVLRAQAQTRTAVQG